jgi:hypothetical protein
MEAVSPQRRREHRDEMSFFFTAERPAKKNAHALRARSLRGVAEANSGLAIQKNQRAIFSINREEIPRYARNRLRNLFEIEYENYEEYRR